MKGSLCTEVRIPHKKQGKEGKAQSTVLHSRFQGDKSEIHYSRDVKHLGWPGFLNGGTIKGQEGADRSRSSTYMGVSIDLAMPVASRDGLSPPAARPWKRKDNKSVSEALF